MSFNLNKVNLAGRLTRDPEVRFLDNSRAVCSFGLAVNESWKDKEGSKKEHANFIDIECFGRTAELVGQYLKKGSSCYLEGKLRLDSWQDKDGQKRSKLKVVADSVQFLDSGNRGQAGTADDPLPSENAAPKPQIPAAGSGGNDEPPFNSFLGADTWG